MNPIAMLRTSLRLGKGIAGRRCPESFSRRTFTSLPLNTKSILKLENELKIFFAPKKQSSIGAFIRTFSSSKPASQDPINQSQESSKSQSQSTHSQTTKPIVGYWLLTTASLVFSIVILGGVTRLTESGLSIVEWNLIKGMKPPISEEEWREEFAKYADFPEYKL